MHFCCILNVSLQAGTSHVRLNSQNSESHTEFSVEETAAPRLDESSLRAEELERANSRHGESYAESSVEETAAPRLGESSLRAEELERLSPQLLATASPAQVLKSVLILANASPTLQAAWKNPQLLDWVSPAKVLKSKSRLCPQLLATASPAQVLKSGLILATASPTLNSAWKRPQLLASASAVREALELKS